MTSTVLITDHAKLRFDERLGLKTDARTLRTAELAWERGVDRDTTDNVQLRRFLDLKTIDENCTIIKFFNGVVFIFGTDSNKPVLITVYALPKNIFCKYHKGEKVRNRKRFQKLHPELM